MKLSHHWRRRFSWLNLPGALLILLLQRTPALQLAESAGEFAVVSPAGQLLRALVGTVASLGALHTLAGATTGPVVTQLVSDTNQPATATAGQSFSEKVFFYSPSVTIVAQSWSVSNNLPPGITVQGGTLQGNQIVAETPSGTLTLSGVPTTGGTYNVTITGYQYANLTPPSTSATATIVVSGSIVVTAPTISQQPQSQTVMAGSNVTFSVSATGSPSPSYQWQKDGVSLSGDTGSSLTLSNVQPSSAGNYTVVVSNAGGSLTSSAATLTVNVPVPDAPPTLGAFASGTTEVTLTWLAPTNVAPTGYKLDRALDSGFSTGLVSVDLATAATSYVDSTAAAGTTYYYRVYAVDSAGTSPASGAKQVQTPSSVGTAASGFANISTRAYCGTGNSVTIGGFVVSGSTSKRVLIRAVGPSLTSQGIASTEVLADPSISVHDALHSNTVVATNDNLADNTNAADIVSVASQLGATPLLATDTTSSALLITLAPGVYSFVVQGKNSTSGIVLLEVYDADLGAGSSHFANISSRADCTTGNGVAIGGFVVSGGTPKHVLIRAVGPTLATEGVALNSVLVDPTIELHDALHGNALIAINDNAGDNANAADIVSTGARIGATPLAASDTGSAALLLTLRPGVYSFVARGKNSGTGIVLVEVYDAD